MFARLLPLLLPLTLTLGCECTGNVGSDDRDAGDARRPSQRLDECGNGLDDDGNGSIDDGCPCAPGETQRCFSGALSSNEVGACQSGTQTCAAIDGSEWGDWGMSDCVGEVLPATEACDGSDADCDGAVDEGCPCTDGMERACGDEFILAPCMAGTQTCRSGTWSSCEGAVGPSADVCTDEIDNDCDGLTNEGCECPYPPVPEVCRDAVDNDCDGAIDEPECTPDWPGDAGVPYDAGMCDPSLGAPRLIAPLSTSRVTSHRPAVRWELPAGASEARLELCSDPECADVLEIVDAATEAQPTRGLPVGPVFFRVRTVAGDRFGCDTSHTWEVFVTAADTAVDTAQGHVLDVNRDGHPDVLAGGFQHVEGGTWISDAVHVLHGGIAGPVTPPALSVTDAAPMYTLVGVGDLDGDGFGDAVLLRLSGACDVLRGGPLGLETTVAFTMADCRTVSGVGDFDGDGYGDLALAFENAPAQLVFGAAALGAMVRVPDSVSIPNGWGFVHRAGDVNGDGLGDVVINRIVKIRDAVHHNRYTPHFYAGNAARTWGTPTLLAYIDPVGLAVPDGYAAGDFNGDGLGDLLFAPTGDGALHVGGASGPSAPIAVPLGEAPTTLAAAGRLGDVDADGYEDVELYGRVRHGNLTGLGPPAETLASFCENRARCAISGAGDLDGDGFEDVLESHHDTFVVRWIGGRIAGLGAGRVLAVGPTDRWYPVSAMSDD